MVHNDILTNVFRQSQDLCDNVVCTICYMEDETIHVSRDYVNAKLASTFASHWSQNTHSLLSLPALESASLRQPFSRKVMYHYHVLSIIPTSKAELGVVRVERKTKISWLVVENYIANENHCLQRIGEMRRGIRNAVQEH
ncbi:hypothetical protein CR513_33771, partial [Mucuna pruriens]